jgi:AraC-like DNA-binding protein
VPVIWAWDKLRISGGRASVGELANGLRYTRKRLIARFRDHVGLSPKTMARVVRFERAVRLLRSGEPVGGAEIAYRCRYYDQAHFNREFREFTGRTPTEFAANVLPYGNGVTP